MFKQSKWNFVFLLLLCITMLCGCSSDSSTPPQNESDGYLTIKEESERYSGLVLNEYIPVVSNSNRVVVEDSLVDIDGTTLKTFKTEFTFDSGIESIPYNLAFYGKHVLDITYYKDQAVINSETKTVTRVSEEYNIASLIATVPATYYTLLAMDQNGIKEYIDPTVPTIIRLERSDAYDWSKLPQNVSSSPFYDNSQFEGIQSSVTEYREYIKYLYELNPSSKFNYFGNDYWPDDMYFLFDAKIPLEQMSFVFFSDGVGTYNTFRAIFGDGTGEDKSLSEYAKYESKWNELKAKYEADDINFKVSVEELRGIVPVMVNDNTIDAYWIVSRKNTDTFGSSSAYTNKVASCDRAIALNMNDLFNALTSSEKETFKNLYAIDTSTIDQINGKPVLIFLGTSTDFETNLREYLIAMNALCGADYNCYYKGHPGHVYNGKENREKILEETGVKAIDPAIPAELFSLFIDDLVYAGYTSSTFQNVDNRCVFLAFTGEKSSVDYENRVEMYIEKLGDAEFRIVKDCLTSNPQMTIWNGIDDINTLTWSPYFE